MSNRLMQILASLAQRRALRTLDTICETQHQISTRKLGQHLNQIDNELSGCAHYLRIEYDALTSKIAALEAELAQLRAGQEPVAIPDSDGLYVVSLRDNWDGEGDVYTLLARKDEKGEWYADESGKPLITCVGDEVLRVWSLTEQAPQAITVTDDLPGMWHESDLSGGATDCENRNSPTPQPSAVPDADIACDRAYRNGLIAGFGFGINGDEEGYQRSLNCYQQGIHEALAAAPSAPATVQGDGWIPVSERLPESELTVLAFYQNSHGKGRRVRAEYIAAKTKSADDGWDSDEPADYDEQADEYFWPAGWYEVMDNWDDLTHMVIHEGEVTHWMPLPAAPAIAAARNGEAV